LSTQPILRSPTALNLPPRGMKIREAAYYAGVSPWHIETAIRSKELPALKLCRHFTILVEDLDAYLDRNRAKLDQAKVVQ